MTKAQKKALQRSMNPGTGLVEWRPLMEALQQLFPMTNGAGSRVAFKEPGDTMCIYERINKEVWPAQAARIRKFIERNCPQVRHGSQSAERGAAPKGR